MASIIPRAIGIYRSAGCETISGFSSYHFFNSPEAPFTTFLKDKKMVGCLGLALQEIMFVETSETISPRNGSSSSEMRSAGARSRSH
jgi:hypothetical protein